MLPLPVRQISQAKEAPLSEPQTIAAVQHNTPRISKEIPMASEQVTPRGDTRFQRYRAAAAPAVAPARWWQCIRRSVSPDPKVTAKAEHTEEEVASRSAQEVLDVLCQGQRDLEVSGSLGPPSEQQRSTSAGDSSDRNSTSSAEEPSSPSSGHASTFTFAPAERETGDGFQRPRAGSVRSVWTQSQSVRAGTSSGVQKKNCQDVVTSDKDVPGLLSVAVCDGNGLWGHLVAEAVAKHLLRLLRDHAASLTELVPVSEDAQAAVWRAVAAGLQEGLLQDPALADKVEHSGTTMTCAVVTSDYIYAAWIGDSQMCFEYTDGSVHITPKHCFDTQRERAAVQKKGGRLVDLCGNIRLTSDAGDVTIAIPRCLGNVGFSGLVREASCCAVPTERVARVWLASDGVWDRLSPKEVRELADPDKVTAEACRRWLALSHGQRADDMSCLRIERA